MMLQMLSVSWSKHHGLVPLSMERPAVCCMHLCGEFLQVSLLLNCARTI